MSLVIYVLEQQHDEHASDASSASLNLPGKNQVMDLREDSTEEMVETFLTRKSSYFARAEDMTVDVGVSRDNAVVLPTREPTCPRRTRSIFTEANVLCYVHTLYIDRLFYFRNKRKFYCRLIRTTRQLVPVHIYSRSFSV